MTGLVVTGVVIFIICLVVISKVYFELKDEVLQLYRKIKLSEECKEEEMDILCEIIGKNYKEDVNLVLEVEYGESGSNAVVFMDGQYFVMTSDYMRYPLTHIIKEARKIKSYKEVLCCEKGEK